MVKGKAKNSELLSEAVNYIIELTEDDETVCLALGHDYDGKEWCPKECNRIPDDGCVLHLLRMRIKDEQPPYTGGSFL